MMLRVCPECYKAFFMSFGLDRARCPHCGVYFTERRASKRVRKELDLTLSLDGALYTAVTTDFCDGGAGIVIDGRYIEKDTMLHVNIEALRLRRQAKTVWARQVSRSAVSAGLKLL